METVRGTVSGPNGRSPRRPGLERPLHDCASAAKPSARCLHRVAPACPPAGALDASACWSVWPLWQDHRQCGLSRRAPVQAGGCPAAPLCRGLSKFGRQVIEVFSESRVLAPARPRAGAVAACNGAISRPHPAQTTKTRHGVTPGSCPGQRRALHGTT